MKRKTKSYKPRISCCIYVQFSLILRSESSYFFMFNGLSRQQLAVTLIEYILAENFTLGYVKNSVL